MKFDYSEFDTINKIVDDLLQSEDFVNNVKIYLKDRVDTTVNFKQKSLTYSFFTMTIRNVYSLWHQSPLTKSWREDEKSRKIINGIDYSENHPDNISGKIFDICLERIENASKS